MSDNLTPVFVMSAIASWAPTTFLKWSEENHKAHLMQLWQDTMSGKTEWRYVTSADPTVPA